MTNHVKLCDKNWWSIKKYIVFFYYCDSTALLQDSSKTLVCFLLSSFQSFERFTTNFEENQPFGVYRLFKCPFANLVGTMLCKMITTLEMGFRSKVNLYSILRSINKHDSKELDFRNSLDARKESKGKKISLLYWNVLETKQITMQFCFVVNFIVCFYPMRLWRSY